MQINEFNGSALNCIDLLLPKRSKLAYAELSFDRKSSVRIIL